MQELITSFLIQSRECSLPGIGKLMIIAAPAELDIANKRILPPTDEIHFTERPDKNIDDLVKYVSCQRNISSGEAMEKITTWCTGIKDQLSSGKKIYFQSIGQLQKNASGNISFVAASPEYCLKPVMAERVIRKNSDHAMLVGDRETTSAAMNQFLNEEEIVKRSTWKIIALILLLTAVTILAINFYSRSFHETGNQSRHWPADPGSTYSTQ